MARLPVEQLQTPVREIKLEGAKVYHMPNWHNLSHPERLAVIRQIAMMRGRDHRIAKLCHRILVKNKIKPREYEKQCDAILKWVQNPRNVYYLNEPGERLQDPIHTLRVGHADCDDQVLLLCAMFEAIGLPWKLVLSGRDRSTGEKVRYIEGDQVPAGVRWTHIYCMVGCPPGRGMRWYFCEPTVDGVPLGWDVVDGDHRFLPEMSAPKTKTPTLFQPTYSPDHKPSRLPPARHRSPAYAEAYGNPSSGLMVGGATGAALAAETESAEGLDYAKIAQAIVTGVLVSVGTALALDMINGQGLWTKKGNIVERFRKSVR